MSGTFSRLGIKQRTKEAIPALMELTLHGGVWGLTKYLFENYKCYRQKQVRGQGGRGILDDRERSDEKGDI